MRTGRWWVGAGLAALASLWMRTGFPVHAISTAVYDDAWFVRHALLIGSGQWLGPYSSLTLIKGVFYPLFILACLLCAVPLLVAEHAVYLAACGGVAILVRRHAGPRLATALFLVLAFNPVFWTSELNRVIREGLYVSLTFGCVGLTVAAVFPAKLQGPAWRTGGALGLALGAFWLTREEGPWLLPALAAVVVVSLISRRRTARAARLVGPLALAATVAVGMVAGVAALNWRQYGVFLTTEFQGGAFPRAYGALARITPDHWQPYVVFPADAQARAYAVSSAAAELAPVLGGPRGRVWAQTGCEQTHTDPCPGILAGWFMWALREAAATAGHDGTATEAQAFFDRLAREINAACESGQIPCGPARSGLAPPWRWDYTAGTARAAWRLAGIMARVAPDSVGSAPSEGGLYGEAQFTDVTGPTAPGTAERTVVTGRLAGQAALHVQGPPGQPAREWLATQPEPEIAGAAATSPTVRFELQTTCEAQCDMVLTTPDGGSFSFPVPSLKVGQALPATAPLLTIESVGRVDPGAAGARIKALKQGIARTIAAGYRAVLPPAVILGLVGTGLAMVRWRRRPPPAALMALTIAAWTAAGSRLLLLAYLDACAIPAVNVLYAAPVSPLVITATMTGLWLGGTALIRDRGASPSQPPP